MRPKPTRPLQRILIIALALGLAAIFGLPAPAQDKPTSQPTSKPTPKRTFDPFAGLPPMKATGKERSFRFRPGPKPPGSIGTTKRIPFPPPKPPKRRANAPKVKPRPLKLLRIRPTGNVGNINAVTVSFNQPMIPLGSLASTKTQKPPFRIKPQPPGRFRWLGTRTVSFEPVQRMPYATRYTVHVPKGVRSALGSTLKTSKTVRFTTPRLRWSRTIPYYKQVTGRKPVIALLFNQRIRTKALLPFLRLEGPRRLLVGPRRSIPYRVVPPAKWRTLKAIRHTVKAWRKDRTIVLIPKRKLPKNTTFNITLQQGAKGAEGPLPTRKTQRLPFRTFPPLKVKKVYCSNPIRGPWGWRNIDRTYCRPNSSIIIRFNNNIKVHPKLKSFFSTSPRLPKPSIRHYGSPISLSHTGGLKPNTRYRVIIRKGIVDTYKQKLHYTQSKIVRSGSATPYLTMPRRGLAALEQRAQPRFVVKMRNIPRLRERYVIVKPKDFQRFLLLTSAVSSRKYRTRNPLAKVKLALDRNLSTKAKPNTPHKHTVDLSAVLGGKPGLVFVMLSAGALKKHTRWRSHHYALLIQVTNIGLMVRYDTQNIIALVTNLHDGKPKAQTKLTLLHQETGKILWRGKSDKKGYAIIPGRRKLPQKGPYLLQAHQGKDTAYTHITNGGYGAIGYIRGYSRYDRPTPTHTNAALLFTERSPYKPGETVHIRGILRRRVNTPKGSLVKLGAGTSKTVHYTIRSPRWQILKKATTPLDAAGTFSIDYKLKTLADLGMYRIQGYVKTKKKRVPFNGTFVVQAYRTPEYKVAVKAPKGPHFLSQTTKLTIQGRYYFGAPMRKATTTWILRRTASSFVPPRQPPGFRFGVRSPYRWGWAHRYGRRGGRYGGYYRSRHHGKIIARGKGKLDNKGHLHIKATLKHPKGKFAHKGPYAFTLEAQVVSKSRQSIAGRKQLIAHRAAVYVGLHPTKTMLKANTKLTAEALVADIAGKRLPQIPLSIRAIRKRTTRRTIKTKTGWQYRYTVKDITTASCKLTSAQTISRCKLLLKEPGRYTIEASAKDKQGRWATTRTNVYVYGPGYVPWKTNNPERIELITDRKSYKPGQKARILIKSPFRKARGILTIERNGIAEHRPISLVGSAQALSVPIRSEYVPNFYVSVALARGRVPLAQLGASGKDADDLGRPKFAFGRVKLPVSLTQKRLRVTLTPSAKTIRPGSKLTLKLRVSDYKRRPAAALVTIALVDEGVLSLLGFQTPNPLTAFHVTRPSSTVLRDLRRSLIHQQKRKTVASKNKVTLRLSSANIGGQLSVKADAIKIVKKSAPARSAFSFFGFAKQKRRALKPASPPRSQLREEAKDSDDGERSRNTRGPQPIRVRALFAATAFYKASLATNAKGEASLTIPMPDNLTTFRIMAVAIDREIPDRFGNGEDQITVRKPLLLRPALPRFANVSDQFQAAVVVNNETKRAGRVRVLIRGINVRFLEKTQKTVRIPAGEAREVRFQVAVTHPGIARFQFAATLGKTRDAVERKIPILVPATAEAFATYGTTNDSVAQPVTPPKDALPLFGGLKLSLSSTALTGLQDAVRYLVEYPFECTEQTASRAMPIIALKRILPAFRIGSLKDQSTMKQFATRAIQKLRRLQRSDGGWGYWQRSRISWLWISSYATYTLLRAKEAGYTVDKQTLQRASNFLMTRLRYPYYWERKNYTTQVMAAWVLTEQKRNVSSHLNRLYNKRKQLPLFAKAWLMHALFRQNAKDPRVDSLMQTLQNRVTETAGSAHFAEATTESLRLLMHSSDRTDAIILRVLLDVKPKHPLIPKVVRGIMKARIRGRWSTTQSNAYAMLALSKYFDTYEKTTPNFSLQHWLGNGFLGSSTFKGRSMTVQQQTIPMRFLQTQGKQNLILAKRGKGRLYYRIGMRYAPKNLQLPPEEQGFSLSRTYEAIGDKSAVKRLKQGAYRFKAGANIRVRLRITVPARRYYVAVVDPLPAGLEAVNLAFKTSASSTLTGHINHKIYDSRSSYSLFAFDHQEKRDAMVVLFSNRLPAGVYEYTYIARATTIGDFIIPPARAEEMYAPEVFGRTATMHATVTP